VVFVYVTSYCSTACLNGEIKLIYHDIKVYCFELSGEVHFLRRIAFALLALCSAYIFIQFVSFR